MRDDVLRLLTYTHRVFSGQEALGYGFATQVSETPFNDALALAHEIASKSPSAMVQATNQEDSANLCALTLRIPLGDAYPWGTDHELRGLRESLALIQRKNKGLHPKGHYPVPEQMYPKGHYSNRGDGGAP